MRRTALAALIAAACLPAIARAGDKVQTTDEANREDIQGAAQAPLRDLNVVRTKIPDTLLQAIADPYKRPELNLKLNRKGQCAELTELLKPLDAALGADLDTPSKDEDDLLDKGRGTALGAAAALASDVIPFRGWVRKLSGAERHDRLVQAAITAGAVRRAYLKGLGEARGCEPPATPSHMLTAVAEQSPPVGDRRRFRPRYAPR
jgi:hypothetical protein